MHPLYSLRLGVTCLSDVLVNLILWELVRLRWAWQRHSVSHAACGRVVMCVGVCFDGFSVYICIFWVRSLWIVFVNFSVLYGQFLNEWFFLFVCRLTFVGLIRCVRAYRLSGWLTTALTYQLRNNGGEPECFEVFGVFMGFRCNWFWGDERIWDDEPVLRSKRFWTWRVCLWATLRGRLRSR